VKIHEDDCPALGDWTYAYSYTLDQFKREPHACTCRAAADLRELVEAAEEIGMHLTFQLKGDASRLDAALQPFRAEGKKELI
jgi:hypothetical protein